jgi:hypothetical protein
MLVEEGDERAARVARHATVVGASYGALTRRLLCVSFTTTVCLAVSSLCGS